jgi:hypothetical protein
MTEARRCLLVAVPLLLAGCTTHYEKPGGTRDEFELAEAECRMGAAKIRGDLRSADYYQACLRTKGWRRADTSW